MTGPSLFNCYKEICKDYIKASKNKDHFFEPKKILSKILESDLQPEEKLTNNEDNYISINEIDEKGIYFV